MSSRNSRWFALSREHGTIVSMKRVYWIGIFGLVAICAMGEFLAYQDFLEKEPLIANNTSACSPKVRFSLLYPVEIYNPLNFNTPEETKATKIKTGSTSTQASEPTNPVSSPVSPAPVSINTNSRSYPLHQQITTTVFWIGEESNEENGFIANSDSAWDSMWQEHFGGVDNPDKREGFCPAFEAKENPFYVALPYNDLDDNGNRRKNAADIVYWGKDKNYTSSESMVKNHWLKITKNNRTVYAQWEDAGPFNYNDSNYVFGTERPSNTENSGAGLDVSPAVRDYLGLNDIDQVDWQFVDASDVPEGVWKQIVTTSQISF